MKRFAETALRKKIKDIIQSPFFFWGLFGILLLGPVAWYVIVNWNTLNIYNRSFWVKCYDSTMQFAMGIWPEVVASFFIGWFIYLYQKWIKENFLTPESLTIRVPLMLGSAPIFVSQKLRYFEDERINVDLDFRYAGIDTLEDLKKGKCQFAVASDVALTTFLSISNNFNFKIYSLPFVKITGHIKILVEKGSGIVNLNDMQGKKIAYIKDSVHHHFFEKVMRKDNNLQCEPIEKLTIMECFREVIYGDADACIFWEPHYLSMKNNFGLVEIDFNQSYQWFLCLITTQEYYNEKKNLHKRMFKALKKAVNECEKDKNMAASGCYDYMLEEFTGVSEHQLLSLLNEPQQTGTHSYKIDEFIKKDYEEKLASLHADKYYNGSSQYLLSCLWPGY